jgi:alanyl-tRNA synthetase
MTSAQIRQSFLDFFREKQHTIVPSSSLLPDAPNLLFTNAGMNQFVPIFLGQTNCPYRPGRAADTQKCIRAGGKHNDLEDVGLDTYHHTFFEMLGNWSFGDYFKKEAIDWAWELVVLRWGLPKERLYATYFGGDDKIAPDNEAKELWLRYLPADHVVPGNRKDNFWMMGDTGPCGPCSELHVDLTPAGNGGAKLVNAGTPQCIEIWNLVFIQFNANPDGSLTPLPAKHVDTGMGFERACSIIQCTDNFRDFNKRISNYETDVFTPIFRELENLSGKKYGSELQNPTDIAFRVIADHIRCLSFAIADGIAPSNEGRGYVLRRILRRAVRYGRNLGFHEPFFYKLVDVVAENFGDTFPELRKNKARVQNTLKAEEESFNRTLDRGIELFEQVAGGARFHAPATAGGLAEASPSVVFPAADAFKLYDTYGFPLDLTELMARERGLTVDAAGVEKLMEEQRQRARDDHEKKKSVVTVVTEGLEVKPTQFLGYDNLEAEAVVEVVVGAPFRARPAEESRPEGRSHEEELLEIILDRTPFYAEMGGQVGDTGKIGGLSVLDTQKQGELVVHRAKLVSGQAPEVGQAVRVAVDAERRANIQRHHTATHLFHWALHEVVSKDSRQRGSLVAPDRFRFDFNHPEKLTDAQIADIERLVNERIKANEPVFWTEVPFADVQKNGCIQQFFGEKYGDVVRVLQVGGHAGKFDGFSMELCGGTHVKNTGDIGLFKLAKESAIAAGIRRAEAVCGKFAVEFIEQQQAAATAEAEKAKAFEAQKAEDRRRKAEMEAQAPAIAAELLVRARPPGAPLVAELPGADANLLRAVVEALKPKLTSGVVVLGGVSEGKVSLICYVTPDLMKAGKQAGKIVGAVAKLCGGGGGGRPDLATAGGKQPEKLAEALAEVAGIVS